MTDYIRKAVELADGWEYEIHAGQVSTYIRTLEGYRGTDGSQELLDALAAQLERQYLVASDDTTFDVVKFVTYCTMMRKQSLGTDLTEWRIKYFVDSGVLSDG